MNIKEAFEPTKFMDIEEVLGPLGGPANLELMCEARNFVHWGNSVSFEVGTILYKVSKGYSILFRCDYWSIAEYRSGTRTNHHSHVTDPELLANLFKHYSGYSAFF